MKHNKSTSGNFILLGIIVCLFVFTACKAGKDQTGYEVKIISDMVRPVPYEAYSENPVFKNKQTMQNPVPGTVHRGAFIDDAVQENPLKITVQNMDRGKQLFRNYCMVCHGVFGDGDGPIIPKFPNPPSLKSDRLMAFSDRTIFDTITHGKGNMPAHAGQIEPLDRWKIVLYIKNEVQKQSQP